MKKLTGFLATAVLAGTMLVSAAPAQAWPWYPESRYQTYERILGNYAPYSRERIRTAGYKWCEWRDLGGAMYAESYLRGVISSSTMRSRIKYAADRSLC